MGKDGVATFEVEFEMKCPAQKFFNFYTDHVTLLPKVLPHIFKSATVVKGDGKSVGSVIDWEYMLGEPPTLLTSRQTIEAIDEENMILTQRMYGGDIGEKFNLCRPTMKAFKKGDKDYVRWSLEIKMKNDEKPDPHGYMEFVEKFTKEFDSNLAKCH